MEEWFFRAQEQDCKRGGQIEKENWLNGKEVGRPEER